MGHAIASHDCHMKELKKHDCWTTTEAALTQDLSEDLQHAWERTEVGSSANDLGAEQAPITGVAGFSPDPVAR